MNSRTSRVWELDFFRGIALILMVYFHLVFDLKEIYNYPINYGSGPNYFIGKASVILFMIISGISCSFSRSNIKRGFKILIIALILTIVTHLYGEGFGVKFGVLHFFAVALLLSSLLMKIPRKLLPFIALLTFIIGYFTEKATVSMPFLFPFGLTTSSFYSSDYYPLFPWLGFFITGLFLGTTIYRDRISLFSSFKYSPESKNFPTKLIKIISFVGKNTLLIYVIHQPVIIAILYILTTLTKK